MGQTPSEIVCAQALKTDFEPTYIVGQGVAGRVCARVCKAHSASPIRAVRAESLVCRRTAWLCARDRSNCSRPGNNDVEYVRYHILCHILYCIRYHTRYIVYTIANTRYYHYYRMKSAMKANEQHRTRYHTAMINIVYDVIYVIVHDVTCDSYHEIYSAFRHAPTA